LSGESFPACTIVNPGAPVSYAEKKKKKRKKKNQKEKKKKKKTKNTILQSEDFRQKKSIGCYDRDPLTPRRGGGEMLKEGV